MKSVLLLTFAVSCLRAAQPSLTARQVIEKIEQHTAAPWQGPTVDTFKAGNPEAVVTGIATTFADTFDVLQKAAASGANLIISHEPTFYNHQDDTNALTSDPVFLAKMAFIQEHHLVVFRFHDHWHYPAMKPDGIMQGEIAALGWERYHDSTDPMLFHMPSTTLEALASSIQQKIGIRNMRVIGNRNMAVSTVAFIPGAAGSDMQIRALERPEVEVLVVGESREWETVEYARDAGLQRAHKALILMGHVVSEEAGMDYCATWLKTFLPGMPVMFIPAGEPFWSPLAKP